MYLLHTVTNIFGMPGAAASPLPLRPPLCQGILLWTPAFCWFSHCTKPCELKMPGVLWDSLLGTSLGVMGFISETSKREKEPWSYEAMNHDSWTASCASPIDCLAFVCQIFNLHKERNTNISDECYTFACFNTHTAWGPWVRDAI